MTDRGRDGGAGDTGSAGVDTVLLDVDGTLVDSTYLHALAWQRSFGKHSIVLPWWRVHRAVGMGGDQLVRHLTDDATEERLGDHLRDEWQQQYRRLVDEVNPFDGATDAVTSLLDSGFRVALASSGQQEFTDAALKLLGLNESDLAAVTSADDSEASKPDPDILTTALRRAGGTAPVVVGDSVWDAEAAAAMKAPCIGVRTGGFSAAELRDAGCREVIDGIDELPAVLQQWRAGD